MAALWFFAAPPAGAQQPAQPPGQPPGQPAAAAALKVAVKAAPPFAMKDASGRWGGLAVDLWRQIAAETGLRFELVETELDDLFAGLASGKYDAGLGALTVTPEREARLDFTHGIHATGLAIAVRPQGGSVWTMLANLVSGPFLYAVGLLLLVLLAVGFLLWVVERRRNTNQFSDKPARGIGDGFWLAAVTMTTVGYGDKAPVTFAGRVVALIWMFAALILISAFTGMIASALTVNRLEGAVRGPEDLPKAQVGSIRTTASARWLAGQRITFRNFDTVEAGLRAVADGQIDAFVYDAPLLKYLVRERFRDNQVAVLPGIFERQTYAIALKAGSPHRERINIALLKITASAAWRDTLFRVLGEK